jgi:hypothetical protein
MKSLEALLTAAIFGSAAAHAHVERSFDGVWIADLETQSGLASDVYVVKDGTYNCSTCETPRSYVADGKPHSVPGDPDVVSEAVSITGPQTMVTHIVGPSLDRTTTMTVAKDDQTATYVSLDRRPGISGVLRTVYLARRTAPALMGEHSVSGTWQGVRYVEVPAEVRTTVLRLAGGKFTYSTPFGSSYTAPINGRYVALKTTGVGGTTVAVRRPTRRRIEERMMYSGRVFLVRTFTIAPDGRTLEVATTDPSRGTTFRAVSRRASATADSCRPANHPHGVRNRAILDLRRTRSSREFAQLGPAQGCNSHREPLN